MCHATLNKIVMATLDGLFISYMRCVWTVFVECKCIYGSKVEKDEPSLSADSSKYESKVVSLMAERQRCRRSMSVSFCR